MRASVVGTSGSGKTTFANRLARIQGIRHIELDALHWLPNWTARPESELRQLLAEAVAEEAWVVDGNYRSVRDLIWPRLTHFIWLNYPFHVVFGRVFYRTLKRSLTQEELFSGNRENLRNAIFSKDSILWWVITTYPKRKKFYRSVFDQNLLPGVELVELTSQAQVEAYLGGLGN
jgi:adenylate kinase family enzyme